MPPSHQPEGSSQALYRELLARFDGLKETVGEIAKDAREARDASLKLTERHDAEDIIGKVAELRGHVDAGFVAARSDLVNAMTPVRAELKDHESRLKAIEDWRTKIEGAGGVLTWLSRNAPWLINGMVSVLALTILLKDKLHLIGGGS